MVCVVEGECDGVCDIESVMVCVCGGGGGGDGVCVCSGGERRVRCVCCGGRGV